MSEIKKLTVIGAGTMGHGIAHVAAASGIDAVLHDVSPEAIAWLTSLAPCSKMRPAPIALCPTSEFPISPSPGSPTAVP